MMKQHGGLGSFLWSFWPLVNVTYCTTKVICKRLVMFNRDRFTVIHLKTLALQCNIMVIVFFPQKICEHWCYKL